MARPTPSSENHMPSENPNSIAQIMTPSISNPTVEMTGALGSAGLDVFADEPRVPPALLALDNVVLLPHVGSATRETRQAMGDLCKANLDAWFRSGKVLTLIPELA